MLGIWHISIKSTTKSDSIKFENSVFDISSVRIKMGGPDPATRLFPARRPLFPRNHCSYFCAWVFIFAAEIRNRTFKSVGSRNSKIIHWRFGHGRTVETGKIPVPSATANTFSNIARFRALICVYILSHAVETVRQMAGVFTWKFDYFKCSLLRFVQIRLYEPVTTNFNYITSSLYSQLGKSLKVCV